MPISQKMHWLLPKTTNKTKWQKSRTNTMGTLGWKDMRKGRTMHGQQTGLLLKWIIIKSTSKTHQKMTFQVMILLPDSRKLWQSMQGQTISIKTTMKKITLRELLLRHSHFRVSKIRKNLRLVCLFICKFSSKMLK